MNRQQRHILLAQLEKEEKLSKDHVFLVKNTEKRKDKQYWVPVSGEVISMFLNSAFEYKYLGEAKAESVLEMIKEIDKAQEGIIGEQANKSASDFQVEINLDDLGFDGAVKSKKAKEKK